MATASTHRTQNRMKQMDVDPDERWNNPTNKTKQTQTATEDKKGPEGTGHTYFNIT